MSKRPPLAKELQSTQGSLAGFFDLTERILKHLREVVSHENEYNGYLLLSSTIAGTTKYARPINQNLFIRDPKDFLRQCRLFGSLLKRGRLVAEQLQATDFELVDRVTYTIQQSIGVGLDFLGESNSARKHVGNRFEELISAIVTAAGVCNEKIVFKIPYVEDGEDRTYSCETDMVLSSEAEVRSSSQLINPNEIVISLKTSSKDRMGKIFLDKMLMKEFAGHPVKVVGIFHNDVQRKGSGRVSFTFVSGLFMVYTKFLTQLEGVYFIDPPPAASKDPFSKHISRFSTFVLKDVWNLLTS